MEEIVRQLTAFLFFTFFFFISVAQSEGGSVVAASAASHNLSLCFSQLLFISFFN